MTPIRVRVGRTCLRATRTVLAQVKGRRHACSVLASLKGGFTSMGVGGSNSFRFMGRLRGKALATGRYVLYGRSADAAGNRSKTLSAGFTIKR